MYTVFTIAVHGGADSLYFFVILHRLILFVMKLINIEEFELYALMYVASLDMKVSKEELKLMRKNVSPELFEYVSEMFMEDSDAESIETIRQASATFLKTDEQKRDFIQKLRALAAVDDVAQIEEVNISMLEKLLL